MKSYRYRPVTATAYRDSPSATVTRRYLTVHYRYITVTKRYGPSLTVPHRPSPSITVPQRYSPLLTVTGIVFKINQMKYTVKEDINKFQNKVYFY